jgi:hypothetical protein
MDFFDNAMVFVAETEHAAQRPGPEPKSHTGRSVFLSILTIVAAISFEFFRHHR